MKPEIQKQAVQLRKKGYSYAEISSSLDVSKSTCSLWLRDVKLAKKAQMRILKVRRNAYLKAASTMKNKRDERDGLIQIRVNNILKDIKINRNLGKILCAVLYWAEGEKRTGALAFTNSDPAMVKTYIQLLRNCFKTDPKKFRALLHLHEYHDQKVQKKFWADLTGIPEARIAIYNKPNSGKNIRKGYPGCISVRYYDVTLAKEVEFLYNSLVRNLGA